MTRDELARLVLALLVRRARLRERARRRAELGRLVLAVLVVLLAIIVAIVSTIPDDPYKAECHELGGRVVSRNLERLCLGPNGVIELAW